MKNNKKKALALFLKVEAKEIKNSSYNLENCFEYGSEEYMVLTDEEASEAVTENIKESLWAFNSDFIIEECGLDMSGVDSLQKMQEETCEGSNDFILSLIKKTCGLDHFVEAAANIDGRGHFLSGYDGKENEETVAGITYFIYRTN